MLIDVLLFDFQRSIHANGMYLSCQAKIIALLVKPSHAAVRSDVDAAPASSQTGKRALPLSGHAKGRETTVLYSRSVCALRDFETALREAPATSGQYQNIFKGAHYILHKNTVKSQIAFLLNVFPLSPSNSVSS
jgi:hypothetical protein